jgi:hypothetical protein
MQSIPNSGLDPFMEGKKDSESAGSGDPAYKSARIRL